eukprot:g1253.t1
MTQNTEWHGKVAVVTGGSSGIGRATALALAARGAKVIMTGRDRKRLDAEAENSGNLEPVLADSADPNHAEMVLEAVHRRCGRLDMIVNNAGAGSPAPIETYDSATIANICAINIVAPSLLLKEALPLLKASKGSVVNIGTAVSRNAAPALAHYAATKAALEHLTRSWAIELAGDGIRVNAVSPGPAKTGALTGMMGLAAETAQAVEAAETAQVPLGRRGLTEDLVPWILRLGSPANQWLTGQIEKASRAEGTRMQIKEAAERLGISERMLRHYENAGLMETRRLENGYRRYSEADLRRAGRIRDLISTGFSTREVRSMSACLSDEGDGPCEDGLPIMLKKLEHIDRLRADLDARREAVLGRIAVLQAAKAAPQGKRHRSRQVA